MPPLDDPPALTSITPDRNDKTKEAGFWLNRKDTEATAKFFGHINNVKSIWQGK